MSNEKEDRAIIEITRFLESLFNVYERKTGVGLYVENAEFFDETGVVQWNVFPVNRKPYEVRRNPYEVREPVSVMHVKIAPEEDGTVDFANGLLSVSFSVDGKPSWWYRTDTQLHVFVQKFTEHYYNYIVKKVKE